jgi:ATP-dependent DNA helicase PIF1
MQYRALSEEQQIVVDTILSGTNVFYTGSAGAGKSTVLRAFVPALRRQGKKLHTIAPTGRAALAISETTAYMYAGWRVGDFEKSWEQLERKARGETVWQRLTSTDVLVIDEISMLANCERSYADRTWQA